MMACHPCWPAARKRDASCSLEKPSLCLLSATSASLRATFRARRARRGAEVAEANAEVLDKANASLFCSNFDHLAPKDRPAGCRRWSGTTAPLLQVRNNQNAGSKIID